jgi:cysteine desulfurase
MQALPPGVARVNGPPEQRLPNTLSISIRGLSASAALSQLADKLAASAGAACHSGGKGTALSSVLKAMQVSGERRCLDLRVLPGLPAWQLLLHA